MKLKPCPFCGNTASARVHPDGRDYRAWVECDSCTGAGPTVSSDVSGDEARLLAAELWNRRETKNAPNGAEG